MLEIRFLKRLLCRDYWEKVLFTSNPDFSHSAWTQHVTMPLCPMWLSEVKSTRVFFCWSSSHSPDTPHTNRSVAAGRAAAAAAIGCCWPRPPCCTCRCRGRVVQWVSWGQVLESEYFNASVLVILFTPRLLVHCTRCSTWDSCWPRWWRCSVTEVRRRIYTVAHFSLHFQTVFFVLKVY